MEVLLSAHAVIVVAATAVAVLVFFGLAIYITTQNLRRPVAWVFSLFCLIIAGTYFTSFFTVSQTDSAATVLLFLRLRWAVISFGPTLFLHLIFFYFPSTWQPYRLWILLPTYLLSFALAGVTFFTDLVIAASLPQPPPHTAMPMPGPLMPYQVAFFSLQLLGITAGLTQTYRRTSLASLRRQLRLLILSTAFVFLASTIHYFNIFMGKTLHIPHEVPDALLFLAALLYIIAVTYYGLFFERPLARRKLFYAGLMATSGLVALYLTLTLDRWLMQHTYFPYPPATAALVLALAITFPTTSRWITRQIDRRLFHKERQEQAMLASLSEALATRPLFDGQQRELLDTICILLDIRGGFIATLEPMQSSEWLLVQASRGDVLFRPGDLVHHFPLNVSSGEAQLMTPPYLTTQPESVWSETALLYPLKVANDDGLLVLGEKRDGRPFTASEINFCTTLLEQFGRLEQPAQPYNIQQTASPQAVNGSSPDQQQLIPDVVADQPAPTTPEHITAPLEIRVLGPLQVTRNGHLVPESAWGSEKAKLLLAYLLWKSPTGATREELSEVIWPDRPFEETANVFHVTLHRLRRVLQPQAKGKDEANYILHDRGRYRFNTAAPHWLDIVEFQELVKRSEPANQQAAVELYRGSYLEDAAWALPSEVEVERRRLERLYADALHQLAAQANERQASLYLEKLLAVEPADESARRALILSYLAQGRDDLARRHVEYWQRILAELGLEPSPEIIVFWKSIQAKAVVGLNGFKN